MWPFSHYDLDLCFPPSCRNENCCLKPQNPLVNCRSCKSYDDGKLVLNCRARLKSQGYWFLERGVHWRHLCFHIRREYYPTAPHCYWNILRIVRRDRWWLCPNHSLVVVWNEMANQNSWIEDTRLPNIVNTMTVGDVRSQVISSHGIWHSILFWLNSTIRSHHCMVNLH